MEAPLAQHQGGDGHRFAPGLDDEDVELLPRAEALPPRAYPFVADKGVVDAGLVDQPAPERLQVEEPLVVRLPRPRPTPAWPPPASVQALCRGPNTLTRSTLFDCGCPGGIVASPAGFDLSRKHYLQ